MTQEDKELLLKDLCARLPYKPIVINARIDGGYPTKISPHSQKIGMYLDSSKIEDTKIYLRPMSSMTEEELEECRATCKNRPVGGSVIDYATIETFDRLNKKMFDYRGLIPMGLALEAKEGMYKTE